jgi:hypothetical protein
MFEMNWLKKAETFRMVLVSGGHQMAKPLGDGMLKILHALEDAAHGKDVSGLESLANRVAEEHADEPKPLWEPVDIYGWGLTACFYRNTNHGLWWLARAIRKDMKSPTDKDLAFLDKVLKHLGCDQTKDTIIGPLNAPTGTPRLPFGWWTWQNKFPLYEIHVNKNVSKKKMVRVVRVGAAEADGYVRVDLERPKAQAHADDLGKL